MKKNGSVLWDRILSTLIALSAVVVAVVFVRGQVFKRHDDRLAVRDLDRRKSVLVPNWNETAQKGLWLGPKNAAVTIVEFIDYQCPFCKSFELDLRELRAEYPDDVALVLMHYPLRNHRQAEMAARAVECASDQDRIERIHNLLFEKQDSIGVKDWSSFATDAGVLDLPSFEACRKDPRPKRRIQEGLNAGRLLGVNGTPSVILNGYLLPRPPSQSELRDSIRVALARRPPTQ